MCRHDAGYSGAAGGEGAQPPPPQTGEGAAAGKSAKAVSQQNAAELCVLYYPGDRSAVGSVQELCALVHHKMGLENNRWTMRAKFAANVASERSPVLRVMPLFIKNIAMKAVFDTVGECKSCLCLSNLGRVELPDVMVPYVRRMDFIIGVQAKAPHNCGVVTWGNTAYINCIRSIREPELEYHFYRVLHRLGLPVKVESNMR